ncbi:hypothetical protein JAAARDRAFT_41224 [Jaapia argillacea MUCL 33604]|uniref:DUF7223 domain-containing protein n=1 Tax=Jaapia argillacea MUCL 33604 TaxID=933084 RepID=A0A067P8X5_9AGAM|nr:hypothetical protein JAAARDRAFT_41224 [Jaapia argillacea MUCL 33604]
MVLSLSVFAQASVLVFLFFVRGTFAANDWSQPCFSGVCSYDIGGANVSSSGSLKISGATSAISDITTAAGWQILGCDQNVIAQDIRVVCMDESAGCDHLYQNGAEGTIVRLPQDCGKGPFAVVAKAWVPADQSIPMSFARLLRRDGTMPQVQALSIHTNFSAVDTSKNGNVSFAIQGASIPGQTGDIDFSPTSGTGSQRRSRLGRRFSIGDIFQPLANVINNLNNFNNSLSQKTNVNVDKDLPVFSGSVNCPAVGKIPALAASVNVDLSTRSNASIVYGVVVTGTLVPPQISDFGLYANLNGDINGVLNVKASATGTIDSGVKTLFEVGIPGLDFPGIFTLGPSFLINAQATATVELDVDLAVGLAYSVTNGKLFFPPANGHTSGGIFTPQDSQLQLSVSPSVSATGTIAAHLIPTLQFGVDAFDGVASATIFLDLDASATLKLNLNAGASATIPILNPSSTSSVVTNGTVGTSVSASSKSGPTVQIVVHAPSGSTAVAESTSQPTPSLVTPAGTKVVTPSVAAKPTVKASAPANRAISPRANNVTTSVNGCVDVQSALNVNAGAQGTFLGLFDASTQVPLFSKTFDIFKKCFGTSSSVTIPRRSVGEQRRVIRSRHARLASKRAGLTCSVGIAGPVSLANEVLNSALFVVV